MSHNFFLKLNGVPTSKFNISTGTVLAAEKLSQRCGNWFGDLPPLKGVSEHLATCILSVCLARLSTKGFTLESSIVWLPGDVFDLMVNFGFPPGKPNSYIETVTYYTVQWLLEHRWKEFINHQMKSGVYIGSIEDEVALLTYRDDILIPIVARKEFRRISIHHVLYARWMLAMNLNRVHFYDILNCQVIELDQLELFKVPMSTFDAENIFTTLQEGK